MLGIVLINNELRDDLKKLADWAAQPENWYDIEAAHRGEVIAPGDDERYVKIVGVVGTVRCVFSWSVVRSNKSLFRHLSVSVVDDPNKLPNPELTFEIARMLGFTGSMDDWLIGRGLEGPGLVKNIVIMQRIPFPEQEVKQGEAINDDTQRQ
jgi:hypothetical protein